MILDSGICTVFRKTDTSLPGSMPTVTHVPIFAGWYGALSYQTTPRWQTDGRKDIRVDKRIRIMQCSAIRQNDIVVLEMLNDFDGRSQDALVFHVVRAYHGEDPDGPSPISDLSLEVVQP